LDILFPPQSSSQTPLSNQSPFDQPLSTQHLTLTLPWHETIALPSYDNYGYVGTNAYGMILDEMIIDSMPLPWSPPVTRK